MLKFLKEMRKKSHGDIHCRLDYLEKQIDALGEHINILMKMTCKPEDELTVLCDIYGSDKGSLRFNKRKHTYTQLYYKLFSGIRNNVKSVFECGIGTNNPNLPSTMGIDGKPGASLRVWRDYFKNAIIIGADIDKNILFQEERIYTGFMDQLSPEAIKNFFQSLSPEYPNQFDIMIDDGLHTLEAGVCFFENAFQYLGEEGFYVIEDVESQYIREFENYFKSCKNHDKITVHYEVMANKTVTDNNLIIIRKQ